jgi:hypothetical protein
LEELAMLRKSVTASVVAAAMTTALAATMSPAAATDGPWVYAKIMFEDMPASTVKAKFYGGSDAFSVCIGGSGFATARLQWKTSTLSGRHVRSFYLGRGCSTFDHRFRKGTKVTYRVCAIFERDNVVRCSRWRSGTSTY